MVHYAHIRTDCDGKLIRQTASSHCRNTAKYAQSHLSSIKLSNAAYLAGLLHDCGKFKEEFCHYLEDPHAVRGTVNHTFAGCRFLLESYHTNSSDPMQKLTAELLTVAVGSHHGLFDCIDENRNSGFLHRLSKENIHYSESVDHFLKECASKDELDQLFAESVREISKICELLADGTSEDDDPSEFIFQLSLLARLLLSSLIDGDRRDTAEFMGGFCSAQELPTSENLSVFWAPYLDRLEERLLCFPTDSPISKARREISEQCRVFADREGGIYRLNVPTGGGKTLSSLRYALAHAQKWGKQHLIFTSPLLSILEQNAAVIREYLGDDQSILEHHSNIIHTEDGLDLDQRELAVESWNAPVIITTLVQLLNTLFEGRTTSIRRFQSLCNSVIVIDEVQTVPPRMLTLFNLAISFLAKICGTTVLLCSATQPCLEKTAHPIKGSIPEVIPYDAHLWASFRRTIISDAGGKTLEEIAAFTLDELEQTNSLLLVCNRKDEAEYLFSRLKEHADVSCHLSASMCTAHRRNVLKTLNQALKDGQKCLCVATQVIEAGVDISFRRVIRLAAGMDSVIQAAGRCNRHGESSEPVPVYVVSCQGENLGKLREIQEAKNATLSLLDAYRKRPERFDNDLASDASIRAYYQKLYANMGEGYQDYHLERENATIFDLLAYNTKYCDPDTPCYGQFLINQAFRLAGRRFEVFDSKTRDLVVPYDVGSSLIAELTGQNHPDSAFLADWERRARPYTIAVYEWQLKNLGNAVTEHSGIAVLNPGFYEEDTGLSLRPKQNGFLEV